ncbi:MAG: hypothetical protein M0C28_40355 [Candidatus Moduliflexus flocculans]|nr:hypothetical protein [Candidatus Moduliflexus flocculans]
MFGLFPQDHGRSGPGPARGGGGQAPSGRDPAFRPLVRPGRAVAPAAPHARPLRLADDPPAGEPRDRVPSGPRRRPPGRLRPRRTYGSGASRLAAPANGGATAASGPTAAVVSPAEAPEATRAVEPSPLSTGRRPKRRGRRSFRRPRRRPGGPASRPRSIFSSRSSGRRALSSSCSGSAVGLGGARRLTAEGTALAGPGWRVLLERFLALVSLRRPVPPEKPSRGRRAADLGLAPAGRPLAGRGGRLVRGRALLGPLPRALPHQAGGFPGHAARPDEPGPVLVESALLDRLPRAPQGAGARLRRAGPSRGDQAVGLRREPAGLPALGRVPLEPVGGPARAARPVVVPGAPGGHPQTARSF